MSMGERTAILMARGLVALTLLTVSLVAPPNAAAAIGSYVSGKVLYVNGDAGPDTVVVTCVSGNTKVNGANPDDGPHTCGAIASIYVTAAGGSDVVDLSGVTKSAFPKMSEPSVYGGTEDDDVTTSPVGAFADAGPGADTITGLGGPDRLAGGDGVDTVNGGGGHDTIGGYLHAAVTLTNSQLIEGAETDSLLSIEAAAITVSAALYDGSAFSGPQRVFAAIDTSITTGVGNDTLVFGGYGTGSFDGKAGTDIVEGQARRNMGLNDSVIHTNVGSFTLASIEKAHGFWGGSATKGGTFDARDWSKPLSFRNDSPWKVTFLGGHGKDRAVGGPKADVLRGFGGSDFLRGRGGNDTLSGGGGTDTCKGGPGADTITGCEG